MKARIAGVLGVSFLCTLASAPGAAWAADTEAVAQKVTVLNRAAVTAYGDGDFKKMKSKLLEAVALGKDALEEHPMLARTYLHLGVLYVDGLEDRAAGIKYFAQALKINPSIEITAGMATKTVTEAFEEAKHVPAGGGTTVAKGGAAESTPPRAEEAPAAKEPRATSSAGEGRAAKAVEAEKKRAAAELKEVESQVRQAHADQEKLQKELAQTKENESKERAEKERLQAQLKQFVADAKKQALESEAETKKQALQTEAEAKKQALQADAEAKRQALQAQKEKAERDKVTADGLAREKQEHDAREKLEKQVQDKDKLLADTNKALADVRLRLQQADKDKADKDKIIADGLAREKKERDAKEKLEKERQAWEARESERKANAEKERVEREKLAAGPDVPSRFSEPVYCDVPESAPAETDLYVHCLAQPNLKAKTISFYYRPSSSAVYSSLVLDKSKKGWFMALIPGNRITGRALQYYMEARDGHEKLAASNGKPSSPHVMSLRGDKDRLSLTRRAP